MLDGLKAVGIFIGYVIGLVLAVLLFALLLIAPMETYTCHNYEQVTGIETKYKLMDACYVSTADGWQRWDEYKVRATASEAFSNAVEQQE